MKRALEAYKDQILSFQECNGEFNEDLSYEIVKKVYTQEGEKPTGIFAANDQMAIGAINALKDLGIRVPEEVSVIGFDDISISKYLTPALTTIHCDFKEIADRSVEALIDSIEGKVEKSHQELPLEFVKRESLAFHKE
ncbi:MAG: substrate-binding domain-containing protein [Eisenbergiella sp.]